MEGEYDVGMHGSADFVELLDSNGLSVQADAQVLADHIRAQPVHFGEPVRLLSCSTGAPGNRIAQALVDALGVPVTARSDTLWIFQDGRIAIGPGFADNTGTWKNFLPDSPNVAGGVK